MLRPILLGISLLAMMGNRPIALAQVPPSAAERAGYTGLFAAAARGDAADITRLAASGLENAGAR